MINFSIVGDIFGRIGSILIFLVIVLIVIVWHELGHLLVAKKMKVYCYEYSIGFGPVIFRNKKHETHLVIRAIPLGGFCKIAGEDGNEGVILDNDGNELPQEKLYSNQSKGKKVGILAAGGIMNMILAIVCFYIYIAYAGGFQVPTHDNSITIASESVLSGLGMESGDKITSVKTWKNDDMSYTFKTDNVEQIANAFEYCKPDKVGDVQHFVITYTDISNDDAIEVIETSRVKIDDNEISKLGISMGYYKEYEYNALTATYGVWHFMGVNFYETLRAFGKIFTGDLSNVSGLIGIYEVVEGVTTTTEVLFMDKFMYFIYLLGAISFSLGFFNLIPFPALDGGKIFFIGLEAVTKKKINPNVEATIHFVGIILLFALMIIINIRDIFGLFG